jgi:hypothetical protein
MHGTGGGGEGEGEGTRAKPTIFQNKPKKKNIRTSKRAKANMLVRERS